MTNQDINWSRWLSCRQKIIYEWRYWILVGFPSCRVDQAWISKKFNNMLFSKKEKVWSQGWNLKELTEGHHQDSDLILPREFNFDTMLFSDRSVMSHYSPNNCSPNTFEPWKNIFCDKPWQKIEMYAMWALHCALFRTCKKIEFTVIKRIDW